MWKSRDRNIDEDESDIEIEENPLPPHREDVTHVFVHDVGWKNNLGCALCPAAKHSMPSSISIMLLKPQNSNTFCVLHKHALNKFSLLDLDVSDNLHE